MVALALLLLSGCGKNSAVFKAYDEAKAAALTDPGPAPPNWKPDLKVHLSGLLIDDVIRVGLEKSGEITGEVKIPAVTLTPKATVESAALSQSKACDTCLAVDLDLTGTVDWTAGILGSGKVPFEGSLAFDIELEIKKGPKQWKVFAKPRDVRSASVKVDGWSGAVRNVAEAPLKKWLDEEVIEKLKPVEVTAFDTEGIPLRAARLRAVGKGLVVEMLTSAPNPGVVDVPDGKPGNGFLAWVATDTVVRFAAAESFKAGPVDYDIVPEPRGLAVDKHRFTLQLRLWRIGGAGWWRDYTATGKLGVRDDNVKLLAEDVQEGEKSKGAALADPLFFLGEGIVAREMEKAMKVAIPNVVQQRAQGQGTLTKIDDVIGLGGVLEVHGHVDLIEKPGKPRDGKGGKSKQRFR
ncbi:MAG: hypothetical protein H6737_32115 [Alphaproteobacteria bacterium]|nr:hypothetical protein [Alphaproteobacteria bacterium]